MDQYAGENFGDYADQGMQQQFQQQPPQNYFGMQKLSDDFLQKSVYVQELVNTIFLNLGGKERYYDEENDRWETKELIGIKPLLNDLGLYRISNIVVSFVNHNTAHSFYNSQKRADDRLRNLIVDIIRILAQRYKDYAPEHKKDEGLSIIDLDEIITIIENLAEALLYRAIGGEERRSIREPKIYQQIESRQINQQEDTKKRFGLF